MIEFKNLDKTFQDIHAVNHISGTIRDGMVFGLIGSNGAGKSTLRYALLFFQRGYPADAKLVYDDVPFL